MNTIEKIEKDEIARLTEGKNIPEFSQGDTLKIDVRVREGGRERLQAFEGVCIAKSNRGLNSSFTVRKISYGEGVERVFPLYSPVIDKITVIRKGKVRRAKLYYLRGRRGKSARISEKQDPRREQDKAKEKKPATAKKEAPRAKAAAAKKPAKKKSAAKKADKSKK